MARADEQSELLCFQRQGTEVYLYCDPAKPLRIGKPVVVWFKDHDVCWEARVHRRQSKHIVWVERDMPNGDLQRSRIELDDDTHVIAVAKISEPI